MSHDNNNEIKIVKSADERHHRLKNNKPIGWRLLFEHGHIVHYSNGELANAMVDSHYLSFGKGTQHTAVCKLCAAGARGSCPQGRVVHPVIDMEPYY